MAKAIPNPEPPQFGSGQPLNPIGSSPQSNFDPWNTQDVASDKPAAGPADDVVAQLQAENEELRAIIAELQQELELSSGKTENDWSDRQKEYEGMLDEKTEVIRSLHVKIQDLQNQIRPPTPKEDELFTMSEELERERAQIQQDRRRMEEEARQLKEDEEVMTEEMRKMEIQMARERADMARQRSELTRISEEIRQELERIERDRGLSEKLGQLRSRHADTMRGRSAAAPQAPRPAPPPRSLTPRPGAKPPAQPPTQLSIDLDHEADQAPPADDSKKKDSGMFRRLFGSGG